MLARGSFLDWGEKTKANLFDVARPAYSTQESPQQYLSTTDAKEVPLSASCINQDHISYK